MTDRSKRPTKRGRAPGPSGSGPHDDDPTEVDNPRLPPDDPMPGDSAPKIRAISMKTPNPAAPPRAPEVPPVHVQLRRLSDVTPAKQQSQNLGRLAPPYDPVEARKRSIREYIVWGCVAVILASVIALVVWFAAG